MEPSEGTQILYPIDSYSQESAYLIIFIGGAIIDSLSLYIYLSRVN